MELANSQEVSRRITDQKGEFLFDGLRCDWWRLKVYDYNAPAYHYVETTEQDVTVEPGRSARLTIRVLPRARQIRFIDEGVVEAKLPGSSNR